MMVSVDLWHMLCNTYKSVFQKHEWKGLFAQIFFIFYIFYFDTTDKLTK